MLICHLHIFFREMSLHVFCRCFNWIACWFFLFCFCFCLLLLSSETFCTLDTSSLSNVWFANIFFQSITCLFILLTESFTEKKIYFNKLQFINFSSYGLCLCCQESKNSLLSPRSQGFLSCIFFLKKALHLIFKFVIHLELIFA